LEAIEIPNISIHALQLKRFDTELGDIRGRGLLQTGYRRREDTTGELTS